MTYAKSGWGKRTIENNISSETFQKIAALAEREAGIILSDSKNSMVKSRLTRRLRALNLLNFDAYIEVLESADDGEELRQFVSALTTNVSHFFREKHHFDFLLQTVLPNLRQKLARGGRVRIWSAGCSNGQEPYSIAITLLKSDANIGARDIKILATDIDPEVLRVGASGMYPSSMATGLAEPDGQQFFTRSDNDGQEFLTAKNEVKNLITFRQLNLHADWPISGKFDVIFCRNVLIYFDEKNQEKLYQRFSNALSDDGYLMLGHSERLTGGATNLYQNVGITTYKPSLGNSPHKEP